MLYADMAEIDRILIWNLEINKLMLVNIFELNKNGLVQTSDISIYEILIDTVSLICSICQVLL